VLEIRFNVTLVVLMISFLLEKCNINIFFVTWLGIEEYATLDIVSCNVNNIIFSIFKSV